MIVRIALSVKRCLWNHGADAVYRPSDALPRPFTMPPDVFSTPFTMLTQHLATLPTFVNAFYRPPRRRPPCTILPTSCRRPLPSSRCH
jgi:hypothetical protein